jgi:O-antigen/teichoic acid export membrane protein
MQRFSAARWSPALGGISTVVIMAALTPTRPGPPLVIGTILGCPLVVSAVYLGWVRFAILGAHRPRRAWQRSELVSMLLASSWYAGYTAANTLTLGSGTVIVGAVRGATDAGLYSVASRLLAPIITVIASSGMLLRPGMTEAISRGDVDWARSRYRRGLVLITGVSLALAMIVVAIGPWIGRLWVGPDLAPSRTLLIWVSAFTVTAAVTYQVTGLLMALERVRVAALLAVCAALVSLVSSVVLTRDLGPLGAAVGGLIGSLGVLLPGVAWLARRALNSLEPHVGHPAATS